ERLPRQLRLLDGVLVAVVLVFAFLVASFPATNSDFFLHLASGRLLAEGNYHFGVDPFTFTTEGVRWVNHSWLLDLLAYTLYRVPDVGGTLVVVVKALLAALLAGLMLRVAYRPGQGLWVPASCVALAVLALSPRLMLQPECVSYLFLGLTLYLLRRPRRRREARPDGAAPPPYLSLWLLPPPFLLWVHMDRWCLLGPLTVGLYLLGEVLQQRLAPGAGADAPGPGELRTLGLVLAAGVAACLVNPYHVHAFTLPSLLQPSEAARALGQEGP